MEHTDDTMLDLSAEDTPRRPRPLRWMLRGMLAASGTLMALVILSSPPMLDHVQAGIGWVSARIGGDAEVAMADHELAITDVVQPAEQEQGERTIPQVTQMPTNRLPVHRGRINLED